MNYDQLVLQESQIFERVLRTRSMSSDPRQYAHLYWRRVIEGWSLTDALADLLGLPVLRGGGGERGLSNPDGLDYPQFLEEQSEISTVLLQTRGSWSPADLAHHAMRRLVERGKWTHANLLHDLRGEDLDPVSGGGGGPIIVPGEPPAGAGPSPGPARLRGRCFLRADGQMYKPHATHFMEMFSLWCRDREACKAQIIAIAELSWQYGIVPTYRFLDTLGFYDFWRGREVSPIDFIAKGGYHVPATGGYREQLRDMLLFIKGLGGMVRWSCGDTQMFGSGNAQIERLLDDVRQNADIAAETGTELFEVWEAGNETTLNGIEQPDEARRYLREFKARHPNVLCGLGAPYGTEEKAELLAWLEGGDYSSVHGYRPGNDSINEFEKTLRHLFSVRREGYGGKSDQVAIIQMEPFGTGADVSGGRTNNVEMLTLAAVLSHITAQGWTYMSGNGVRWNGPIHEQPGFREVLRATAQIPNDIYNWHIYRGGNAENAFAAVPGYHGDPGIAEGPHRVDGTTNGRDFWNVVHGGRGRKRIRAQRKVEGVIWNPATDDRQGFSLGHGAELELHYDVGRVVYGVFA